MDSQEIIKFRQGKEMLEKASKILLISHRKPDGDTLGCGCAMKLALDQLSKSADLACVDEIPDNFLYLAEAKNFMKEIDLNLYDLIISLDCGASYMTDFQKKHPNIFDKTIPLINIDHHPSNDNFGMLNIVDSQAASTTMIILRFLSFLKIKFTRQIATCLLTGIYTDTGSFMHSNTTSEVYKTAASLLNSGADMSLIIKNAFKINSVNRLKLWGKVLNSIKVNQNGIAMAVTTKKDLMETDTTVDDLSGVIDLVNSIPDSKFSVLLNEDSTGNVKGSFRTQKDDVDLSKVAEIFGGGGHKKAAGFTIPGKLQQEVRWKIVEE